MYKYFIEKISNISTLMGERALDLGVNLIVLIMVERSIGESGLGIFSFLLSVMVFAGFLSDFGIAGFLEREIAIESKKQVQQQIIRQCFRAVCATSALCAILFFITAVFDTTHTRIEESVAAYLIIAVTIPLQNINRLKIAVLQGQGRFKISARLKTLKRLYLLGASFVLLIWRMPPSYLMAVYLISELGFVISAKKHVRLKNKYKKGKKNDNVRALLEKSRRFMLTGDPLDVILYMDFLILGIFVSSADLGIYAEASILARIFLLVPVSIKPLFRKHYCALAGRNQLASASGTLQLSSSFIFFVHGVLAIYILLFFSDILQTLFLTQMTNLKSFHLFAEILPGLLFFATVASQEPIYEAERQTDLLQQLIIVTAVINLVLNLFFVPFAGSFGAAFATAGAMFGYFLLFGRKLSPALSIRKNRYIVAGAGLYLTYVLFHNFDFGFAVSFVIVPVFLFMLFWMIGFFDSGDAYLTNQWQTGDAHYGK